MSAAPSFVAMVFRENLQNLGNGQFAIFTRWPLEIQLVLLSTNRTDNFTGLFGGYAQNLHLFLLQQAFPKGKVAARVCH